MKKSINVSVVMSEYNTPLNDLKDAIRSILDQTFQNFEFIIVDDGGNNNLAEITDEFDDSRIKIIKNIKNMGLIYSLSNGIKQAQGEYIVRMDTDDIAMPDRIEKIYKFIVSHPEYSAVGSRALEFTGQRENGTFGKAGEKNRKTIMHGDVIIHPSAIIKKSSIEAIGYYKNYARAEDLALWCDLLLSGRRLYVIDDILLKYRVNPNDYAKRKLKNRVGEIKARLHYYPLMGANPFDYLYILKSILSGILPTTFVRAYRNNFVLNQKIKK